ncbi:hypothetical protein VTL71DRAFT_1246 [Oculimacula yallundae]|uniref:F-box domain-containing protein n=1 Tax=Oculimacula yallundae TaxID=86028 RepID=A0ABR4CAY0_9HELO
MEEQVTQGSGWEAILPLRIKPNDTNPSNELITSPSGRLPIDIWYMIRDCLAKKNKEDFMDRSDFEKSLSELQSLRRVSSVFKAVFDPLAFRVVVLIEGIYIDKLSQAVSYPNSRIKENITKFTRAMVLSMYLNSRYRKETCYWIGNATDLEYLVIPACTSMRPCRAAHFIGVLADYLLNFLQNSRGCLLKKSENAFVAQEMTAPVDTYFTSPARRELNGAASGDVLNLAARSNIKRGKNDLPGNGLERLHIQWPSHIDSKSFVPTLGKFPAMAELILEDYNWQHTKEVTVATWDFSRLTNLSLRRVHIMKFLDAVTLSNLRNLKILVIKGCLFLEHRNGIDLKKWIPNMTAMLPRLEEFILHDRWMHTINIRSFFGQPCKLRHLELVDPVYSSRDQMAAADLAHLVTACPDLRFLSTNLDRSRKDTQRFLNTLTQFRRLEGLRLTTTMPDAAPLTKSVPVAVDGDRSTDLNDAETEIDESTEGTKEPDFDFDYARYIFRNLHVEKDGVEFKQLYLIVRNTTPPVGWTPAADGSSHTYTRTAREGWKIKPGKVFRHFESRGKHEETVEYRAVNVGERISDGLARSDLSVLNDMRNGWSRISKHLTLVKTTDPNLQKKLADAIHAAKDRSNDQAVAANQRRTSSSLRAFYSTARSSL